MQALVTGGRQGPDQVQDLALAFVLDLDSGEIIHRTEYTASDGIWIPDIQYCGNCFIGDHWYVCTFNEVLVYEWPPREPVARISDSGFNDLHHCMPWNGHLAVSNTGLETVDVLTLEGELVERYDLLEGEPDARRIDPSVDYRLVPDTKPHVRHGNHLFELAGDLWTAQLRTFDAVCVKDQSKRMEMGVGMPHDGTFFGDRVGFTTTNGHLVFFNASPSYERTTYNLTDMTPELEQLGWCRGLSAIPGSPDKFLVGFSTLRRSKWKEFGYWIKHGHEAPKSRVAVYDLAAGRPEQTWFLGDYRGFQLFQVDVLPDERCI